MGTGRLSCLTILSCSARASLRNRSERTWQPWFRSECPGLGRCGGSGSVGCAGATAGAGFGHWSPASPLLPICDVDVGNPLAPAERSSEVLSPGCPAVFLSGGGNARSPLLRLLKSPGRWSCSRRPARGTHGGHRALMLRRDCLPAGSLRHEGHALQVLLP